MKDTNRRMKWVEEYKENVNEDLFEWGWRLANRLKLVHLMEVQYHSKVAVIYTWILLDLQNEGPYWCNTLEVVKTSDVTPTAIAVISLVWRPLWSLCMASRGTTVSEVIVGYMRSNVLCCKLEPCLVHTFLLEHDVAWPFTVHECWSPFPTLTELMNFFSAVMEVTTLCYICVVLMNLYLNCRWDVQPSIQPWEHEHITFALSRLEASIYPLPQAVEMRAYVLLSTVLRAWINFFPSNWERILQTALVEGVFPLSWMGCWPTPLQS